MSSAGWIKLHRKIREHRFFRKPRRFSDFEAWIDLLLAAEHRPTVQLIQGKPRTIERGQLLVTQVELGKKWLWHRETVKKFLSGLAAESAIDIETGKGADTGFTMITIRNYSHYQDSHEGKSDIGSVINTSSVFGLGTGNVYKEKNKEIRNTPRKKGAVTAGVDPRVKEFIDWWHVEYLSRLKEPYHLNGNAGKVGHRIKSLLATYDLPKIESLALRFLESNDPWVQQYGGYTIEVFLSQINKLISTARAYDSPQQELPE